MTIKAEDIEKTWTDCVGGGNYSGSCFFFVQLKDGRVFSKSSSESIYLKNASWHLQFDPATFGADMENENG